MCLFVMVRARSACCVRGALLALALVACAGGVSGAGGLASKGVVDDRVGNYNLTKTNKHPPKTGEVQWIKKGQNGKVELICSNINYTVIALEDIRFPQLNDTMKSANLTFAHCPLPRGSYADVLAALHYQVADLKQLQLYLWSTDLQASHFIGLPIKSLRLNMNQPWLVPLDPIITEPLLELTELIIFNVLLLPMPASSRLQRVFAMNGKSQGAWGGCDQLEELVLTGWEVHAADVTSNWLTNCTKLRRVHMSQLSTSSIAQVLLGAKTLQWLVIQETVFGSLNLILPHMNLTGLEILDLKNNQLVEINIDDIPMSLTTLDLSNNKFESFQFWLELLQLRPSLKELMLDNNPLNTEHQMCDQLDAPGPQTTLQLLSLRNTGSTRLCFGKWVSPQYLDLSNNNITTLELLELPSTNGAYEWSTVDLRGNPISSVPLTEEDYNTFLKKFNKSNDWGVLLDTDINCDCQHAWFARALRSLPKLRVLDLLRGPVRCSNGKRLVYTPAERLECERFPCDDCVCRRAWSDNTTEAFCEPRMGLQSVPRVPGLRALHAASNRIDTLHVDDLPETLLILNISENQISRLNESVVNKLFSVQERRVWLSGNPLDCECDNRALLTALQQHRTQVADYSSIVCVGSKQAVDSVVASELCDVAGGQVAVTATLVASGVLVALAALAAAVYCRYERPLRIFLYARGWCLCCMQDDDADDDRPFDAFVSFAHADESLVTEQLLPELERAPHSYKLCVHFRDWQPGEMIPTQIRLSVERSRRTIIMLSRNFIQSLWGILEFRTAHESAISDGRVRVVVVVLDDVVDDEGLDAELRGYLRTHTYLKWQDPWFWDKLRYALPHRRIPSTNNAQHPPPQPVIAPTCINLSPDELLPLSVPSDVNLSQHESQPVGAPGDINQSLHELQPVGVLGNDIFSLHEIQPVGVLGNDILSLHEIQPVGVLGDDNLSLHELQPVGVPGDDNLSLHELQPVGVPGDTNLSLHELQPVDVPGDDSLSLHELQPVGAPGDINQSLHELKPVSVPGKDNLSLHEIQPVGVLGDDNLSLHELQPVRVPGDDNLSLHELQPVGVPGDINQLLHELQPVGVPGDDKLSSDELLPFSAPGDVNLSLHE